MRAAEARKKAGELRGLLEQEVLDRALLQALCDRILSALRDPYASKKQLLQDAQRSLYGVDDPQVLAAREVLARLGDRGVDEALRWLDVSRAAEHPRVCTARELLEQARSTTIAVGPLRAATGARA